MSAIDELDFATNAIILGAFDKKSRKLLGTMRLVVGSRGPSEVSRYVELPSVWSQLPFGEARHLCVPRTSKHSLGIKILLFKSFYLTALQHNCESLIIASRQALQGMYRLMHFVDVQESPVTFLPPGTHQQQTVLGLSLPNIEQRWKNDPKLVTHHRVIFEQEHPDLLLPLGNAINPLAGSRVKENWEEAVAAGAFNQAA